jgi:hypothetical protein
MFENDITVSWDTTDIKMCIRRYFYSLKRKDLEAANLEIDFLRSIHYEWSFHPLMRRSDPAAMAIIDDFLKWMDSTPLAGQSINDFTVRRLIS